MDDADKKGAVMVARGEAPGSAAAGRPKAGEAKPAPQRQPAKPAAVSACACERRQPKSRAGAARQACTESPPAATGAVSGNWRIQVGAFNNRATAEAAYARLSGNARWPAEARNIFRSASSSACASGRSLEAAAAAACSAVEVACFPVAPGK